MSFPFYLIGPTASGKTSVAAQLARKIDGEVINADTFQLYADLPVLTAAPTEEEKGEVPHHLYQILPPGEVIDAESFASKLARPAIDEVLSRGKVPIVVGGGGLYLKALTHGLADLPPADPALRQELDRLSPEGRLARLLEVDPEAASATDLANDRYVTRALEISLLTGQPSSKLKSGWKREDPDDLYGACLTWERGVLYDRINRRCDTMFEAGVVDELRDLIATSGDGRSIAGVTRAIGAPIIRQLLDGELGEDEARAAVAQATRRYAKRQITWFRRETWPEAICLIPPPDAGYAVDLILARFPNLIPPPS